MSSTSTLGLAAPFAAGQVGIVNTRQTQFGSSAVAKVEPDGTEMTAAGIRFNLCYLTTVTGIAPVQAIPTTTAHWTIYNSSATKSFIMEELGMFNCVSGTPGVGGQVLCALGAAPAVAITTLATGITVASASAGSVTSKAFVKSGVTLPTNTGWFPVAYNNSPNVGAYPGSGNMINFDVKGKIIVPPLYCLHLATMALAGTSPLFVPHAQWLEAACVLV